MVLPTVLLGLSGPSKGYARSFPQHLHRRLALRKGNSPSRCYRLVEIRVAMNWELITPSKFPRTAGEIMTPLTQPGSPSSHLQPTRGDQAQLPEE